jgi:hypothetical protein
MSSAVIESMSLFGYRDVTPAIFENVMKSRYSNPSSKTDMFDLILESVRIDLAKLLQESHKVTTLFDQSVSTSADMWALELKQVRKLLTKYESNINSSIAYAIEEQQK